MALEKHIEESQYFHVVGGPSLPTILALKTYLKKMPMVQYAHHVTTRKNDFADWVKGVFNEEALARNLRAAKTKDDAIAAIEVAFNAVLKKKIDEPEEMRSKLPTPSTPQASMQVQLSTSSPNASTTSVPITSASTTVAPTTTAAFSTRLSSDVQPAIQSQVASSGLIDAVALQDDEVFNGIKSDIIKHTESVNEKYEGIIKQLQEALVDQFPTELETLSDNLKSRYDDIVANISETRKSGKDCFIPSLVIKPFLSKLALAKATRNPRDFEVAKIVLDQAQYELDDVKNREEINVKKEILAMAGIKE